MDMLKLPEPDPVASWDVLTPWARLDGESAKAHAAFLAYRDLPPGRRGIRFVAAMLDARQSTLEEWSSKFKWVARADAWDRDLQAKADEAAAEERRAAVRRHGQLAAGVLALVGRHITPPKKDANGRELTKEERAAWKPRPEVVRMAAYAVRYGTEIERLALGLPTAITRSQADSEEMVKRAMEAQRATLAVVREGLCEDPTCACCQRIRGRIKQAVEYWLRVEQRLAT